ncbi:MAG: hypothetical protein WCX73_01315 [Candidatus Pacearchaeota archaeon]|jgi:hypothetical protein
MALTDIIGKDAMKKMLGAEIAIDPNSNYDRKTFVKNVGTLVDLNKYSDKLRKNVNDSSALYDLINVLGRYTPGDLETNINTWKSDPHQALIQAKDLDDEGSYAMAKFVEGKREKLLDKLNKEQLYGFFEALVKQKMICKQDTPKNKKIKELAEKSYAIKNAESEGHDPSYIVSGDVQQLMEMASPNKREFIMRNRNAVVASMHIAVVKAIKTEYSKLFKKADGKTIDKTQIKKFLIDNYKIAEEFIDDLPKEERPERWSDNLKPQYMFLATAVQQVEKPKQKMKDNKSYELRKKAAEDLGLIT